MFELPTYAGLTPNSQSPERRWDARALLTLPLATVRPSRLSEAATVGVAPLVLLLGRPYVPPESSFVVIDDDDDDDPEASEKW